MRIVRHGHNLISVIQDVAPIRDLDKEGNLIRRKSGTRSRILLQMVNGKPMVIRGSLMLSGKEIERVLAAG